MAEFCPYRTLKCDGTLRPVEITDIYAGWLSSPWVGRASSTLNCRLSRGKRIHHCLRAEPDYCIGKFLNSRRIGESQPHTSTAGGPYGIQQSRPAIGNPMWCGTGEVPGLLGRTLRHRRPRGPLIVQ